MTHQELPWNEAVKKGQGSIISTDTMFSFYTRMLQDDTEV